MPTKQPTAKVCKHNNSVQDAQVSQQFTIINIDKQNKFRQSLRRLLLGRAGHFSSNHRIYRYVSLKSIYLFSFWCRSRKDSYKIRNVNFISCCMYLRIRISIIVYMKNQRSIKRVESPAIKLRFRYIYIIFTLSI